MHPLRRNLVFVLAWILFWTLMILVAVQDFIRNEHDSELWKPVLWEGSSALAATVLALVQLRGSRSDARLLGTPVRWFASQARWLPLYWIAFVPLAFGLRHGVYALAGQAYRHDPLPRLFLYESMKISLFVGLFTAIRFGVESYHALLDARLRAEQANALLRQAQLQQLTRQMQPHFLFNALNTISELMYADVGRADATLVRLADVLRATLELGHRHQAPLAAELRLARGYAGVMAERFAGRVEISWSIQDELCLDEGRDDAPGEAGAQAGALPGETLPTGALAGVPVPVMSLQPLLENVFKHTVERRRGLTRIAVAVRRRDGILVLSVEDDAGRLRDAAGDGMDEHAGTDSGSGDGLAAPRAGGGIGLSNLRARLAALYGEEASLSLQARPGGGVRAELRLPCRAAPDDGGAPACAS